MSVNRVFRLEVVCRETGEIKGFHMVSSVIETEQEAWSRAIDQFGEPRVLSVKKQESKKARKQESKKARKHENMKAGRENRTPMRPADETDMRGGP